MNGAVKHVGSRRFCTRIVWEELDAKYFQPPESLTEEPVLPPAKSSRFYVPAPYTDAQLGALNPDKVRDWPKSRVVWAIGRLGYSPELRKCSKLFEALILRVGKDLLDSLNTRDLVRVMQAMAYGPGLGSDSIPILLGIRKRFSVKIENVNDLFLVSGIYGHLKLVNRLDWTLSERCVQFTQFLLSELMHRKAKIHSSDFVQLASALLTSNPKLRNRIQGTIDPLVKHAVDHSLRHVKDMAVISRFGKALISLKSRTLFFPDLNAILKSKLGIRWRNLDDLIDFGYWFLLADLLSHSTVDLWMQAVLRHAAFPLAPIPTQQLRIANLILRGKGSDKLIDLAAVEFLDQLESAPVVHAPPSHVSKVIRRMVEATLEPGWLVEGSVGPFQLACVNPERKLVVEWDDMSAFEPPYRRDVARELQSVKRAHLKFAGWRLVLLNPAEFQLTSAQNRDQANLRFKKELDEAVGGEIPWKQKFDTFDGVRRNEHGEQESATSASFTPRIRREAKRKESKLRKTLRSIGKLWRRKTNRKLIRLRPK